MRPGNIETFGEHLGFLGKGSMAPPPTVPQEPTYKDVEVSPGVIYKQDTRCTSTGTRLDIVPCEGPDCGPGEMEEECVDDPQYTALMDEVSAQEEKVRQLEAQLAQMDAEERAAAQAAFDAERTARREKFTEILSSQRSDDEEGFDPAMLALLGLGGLIFIGTTLFVLRKPKPAAPAARKTRRRKRRR